MHFPIPTIHYSKCYYMGVCPLSREPWVFNNPLPSAESYLQPPLDRKRKRHKYCLSELFVLIQLLVYRNLLHGMRNEETKLMSGYGRGK